GIHVLFGLDPEALPNTLNGYLWGECSIAEAAYDVTPESVKANLGSIHLIPCSSKLEDITQVLQEGYDVPLLRQGIKSLIATLDLDYVFIDTHPGLNEETLICVALSNLMVIVLRPDNQDFQGTAVMVDLASKLRVPKVLMLVNRVLAKTDFDSLQRQISQTYSTPVAGIFPNCDEMMELASSGLFCLKYPEHPLTHVIRSVADQLMV
ncbi:MAG: MinD/ParA family protein, partial [Cyanobacteria bacterium J06632_22]